MKNVKPGEKYYPHNYDLFISFLILNTWNYIENSRYSTLHKGDDSEAKLLIDFYNKYRKKYGIEKKSLVVIESGDPEYNIFLAIALSLFDPFKIESFLNYHKKKFIGDNFEDLIEFKVYGFLSLYVPIKNKKRRKMIMKWVNESRKSELIKKKAAKAVVKKAGLVWHPKYIPSLKKLSKKLWKEKFTKRVADFEKVFTEGRIIAWRKDAEHLCYLLHKLRSNDPPLFKAAKGKGHYAGASGFFTDDLRKVTKKKYITNTINKFTTRKKGKPIPERDTIDLMIKQSLL